MCEALFTEYVYQRFGCQLLFKYLSDAEQSCRCRSDFQCSVTETDDLWQFGGAGGRGIGNMVGCMLS